MKVLVVDDHPVVISGCVALLQAEETQVFGAEDAKSGLKAFLRKKPDIVLLDVTLPDTSGFELLRRILKADPGANVIMFSMNTDPSVAMRSLELGAKGFIAKNGNPRELKAAIKRVVDGERYISNSIAVAVALDGGTTRTNPISAMNQREIEVARLLARGKKIAEIADLLDISYKTVANVTSLLKKKVGARSHADLIRLAIEMQI